jgi:hypothetical protein
MKKNITLGISVEGTTEAFFVKFVLQRYLARYNIIIHNPVILGGNITLSRVASSIKLLSSQYDYVTSFYDFYGFQIFNKLPNYNVDNLIDDIKNHDSLKGLNNIIPYVQQYEFETLLFSNINILCKNLHNNLDKQQECIAFFNSSIGDKDTEDINDSIHTAPSKRIISAQKRYKKSIFGFLITQEIGIDEIKSKCKRFGSWLDSIVALNS